MSSINSAKSKSMLEKFFRYIFTNNYIINFIFIIIKYLNRFLSYLVFIKFKFNLYHKCEVLTGPFKGLKYSEPTSVCGPILPKLLGTYESELIPIINLISEKNYNTIYNIGAAEGYYAIGFSMLFKNSTIKAYEIDKEGFKFLKQNVKFNNKDKKIQCINSFANSDIKKITDEEKNLIFSDCEGCEFEIFDKDVLKNLINSDLILEIHTNDYKETLIEKQLKETHSVHRIGYGKTRMIDITEAYNYDIDFINLSKISRENRTEFHYFLIALSS